MVLRVYSWLCTSGRFRRPYRVPESNLGYPSTKQTLYPLYYNSGSKMSLFGIGKGNGTPGGTQGYS